MNSSKITTLISQDAYIYVSDAVEHLLRKNRNFREFKEHHKGYYSHSLRSALLSYDLGKELGLNSEDIKTIVEGALLHDIGKLQIPVFILDSPEKLEGKDLELMLSHPRIGFDMLNDADYPESRLIVVGHHEFQPNRYPRKTHIQGEIELVYPGIQRKLLSERMNNLTQIVAVCETVDALTSVRIYRPSLSLSEVKNILPREFLGSRREYIDMTLNRLS